MTKSKPWYQSKVVWVNLSVLVGSVLMFRYGSAISNEVQIVSLCIINILLRAYTSKSITG